ncbi:hypothetical protein GCM10010360_26190 [Streptomyces nogalater]
MSLIVARLRNQENGACGRSRGRVEGKRGREAGGSVPLPLFQGIQLRRRASRRGVNRSVWLVLVTDTRPGASGRTSVRGSRAAAGGEAGTGGAVSVVRLRGG